MIIVLLKVNFVFSIIMLSSYARHSCMNIYVSNRVGDEMREEKFLIISLINIQQTLKIDD